MDALDLADHPELHQAAADLLTQTFLAVGNNYWAGEKDPVEEVAECLEAPNLAAGLVVDGVLAGWVGIRPLYDAVWELHPLVVGTAFQGKGIGTCLLNAIEARARERGLLGLFLGTDDETFRTTLSAVDLTWTTS